MAANRVFGKRQILILLKQENGRCLDSAHSSLTHQQIVLYPSIYTTVGSLTELSIVDLKASEATGNCYYIICEPPIMYSIV